MSSLSSQEVTREGDWVVGAWRGDIDITNVDTIEGQLLGELRNTDAGLVVDLSEVSYVDSAGIRSLLNLRRLLSQRQQRLLLVVPDGSVLTKALLVGGVTALVPIYGSLEAARDQGR